jgi:hypothetical protein
MNRLRSLAAGIALISVSCRASYPVPPDPTIVAVQIFSVYPLSYVEVGKSYSFYAYAVWSDGAYEPVTEKATWASSDSTILSPGVYAGTFNTKAPGRIDISATYRSATGVLSIPAVVFGSLSYPRLAISAGNPDVYGGKGYLSLTLMTAASSSTPVTTLAAWTSDNPAVATVANGSLEVHGVGPTMIRATYNNLTAECWLSVWPRS